MTDNRFKAKTLAARSYIVEVIDDETTDGAPIFMARNPELRGCKAQGRSKTEALENLDDARIDYVESLLDDGLAVPIPMQSIQTSNRSAVIVATLVFNQTKDKP